MAEIIVLPCNDAYTCILHILSANGVKDAECVAAMMAEHFEAMEELKAE